MKFIIGQAVKLEEKGTGKIFTVWGFPGAFLYGVLADVTGDVLERFEEELDALDEKGEGAARDEDKALLARLEDEQLHTAARLRIAQKRLDADPRSESKRDAVAELKQAAERLQMAITKLRSLE